jgi:hypothetical protein
MWLLILGIGINIYFIQVMRWDQSRPTYFMTDRFGVSLAKYPLNEAVYTKEQIEQWTALKLNTLFSINFATHEKILNEAANYFNPQGYTQYITAVRKSRILDALDAHKYVSVIEINSPLSVLKTIFVDRGQTFAWVLQGKYKISYFNDKNIKNPFVQELDMTILVRRESFSLYEDGISIMTIIA